MQPVMSSERPPPSRRACPACNDLYLLLAGIMRICCLPVSCWYRTRPFHQRPHWQTVHVGTAPRRLSGTPNATWYQTPSGLSEEVPDEECMCL